MRGSSKRSSRRSDFSEYSFSSSHLNDQIRYILPMNTPNRQFILRQNRFSRHFLALQSSGSNDRPIGVGVVALEDSFCFFFVGEDVF
ncbi:hypothetical protein TL16_g08538 [Triparma laevis f. inornata]|uniref:Uncharacterized protein n=1 Tax=Triparma laevis f. inornata TaxID=1714386 RepID=A0A9W7EIP7_9STRA|nr:hypothetical protein TL16_g08538 [Triparma laevis f. inornata]